MMMIMAWMDYNDIRRGGALGVCYIPMNELYAIFRTSCRSTVVPDSHHEAIVCGKALSGMMGVYKLKPSPDREASAKLPIAISPKVA